jgi:hypothetical protein
VPSFDGCTQQGGRSDHGVGKYSLGRNDRLRLPRQEQEGAAGGTGRSFPFCKVQSRERSIHGRTFCLYSFGRTEKVQPRRAPSSSKRGKSELGRGVGRSFPSYQVRRTRKERLSRSPLRLPFTSRSTIRKGQPSIVPSQNKRGRCDWSGARSLLPSVSSSTPRGRNDPELLLPFISSWPGKEGAVWGWGVPS